jgi:uncharacterized repeat protein (TIGR02543 family)
MIKNAWGKVRTLKAWQKVVINVVILCVMAPTTPASAGASDFTISSASQNWYNYIYPRVYGTYPNGNNTTNQYTWYICDSATTFVSTRPGTDPTVTTLSRTIVTDELTNKGCVTFNPNPDPMAGTFGLTQFYASDIAAPSGHTPQKPYVTFTVDATSNAPGNTTAAYVVAPGARFRTLDAFPTMSGNGTTLDPFISTNGTWGGGEAVVQPTTDEYWVCDSVVSIAGSDFVEWYNAPTTDYAGSALATNNCRVLFTGYVDVGSGAIAGVPLSASNYVLTTQVYDSLSPIPTDLVNLPTPLDLHGKYVMRVAIGYPFAAWTATVFIPNSVTTYTVHFDNQGFGSTVADATGVTTITHAQLPTTSAPGYNFLGWSLTSNGSVITGDYTPSSDGTTLYAIWQQIPTASGPPVPAIPDPGQLSSITSCLNLAGPTVGGNSITIAGKFVTSITNILVDGSYLAPTSWSQSATGVTITMPAHRAGATSLQIFNGQAPVLNPCGYLYVDAAPAPTATPTPPSAPTPTLDNGIKLRVYFEMASFTVKGPNLTKLVDLASKIKGLGKKITITVTGFAQPTPGSEMTDSKLSADRANAVAKILRSKGVTTTLTYKGMGRATANVASSRYVEIVASRS